MPLEKLKDVAEIITGSTPSKTKDERILKDKSIQQSMKNATNIPFKTLNMINNFKKVFWIEEISIINFDHSDVIRHPLVSKIVKAYQKNTDDKG